MISPIQGVIHNAFQSMLSRNDKKAMNNLEIEIRELLDSGPNSANAMKKEKFSKLLENGGRKIEYYLKQGVRQYTLFMKNFVHKNIQAQNHPISKNVTRILPSLSLHICVSLFISDLFCNVHTGDSHNRHISFFKEHGFLSRF